MRNIDVKGDSIIVTANINNKPFWDTYNTLNKTRLGRAEINKYQGSKAVDIYVSSESSIGDKNGNVGADYSKANLRKHHLLDGNKIDASRFETPHDFNNLDGHSVKPGVEVDVIGINSLVQGKLDNYGRAFALFHEMRAHLDNDAGDDYAQHDKFGNFFVIAGPLRLHTGSQDPEGNDFLAKPGSDAWEMLKELLTLKIADGNGTKEDQADLEEMRQIDKKNAKKKN